MNATSNTAKKKRFTISGRQTLIIASLLIVAGYLLMTGSGNTSQSFNPDIFSPRRIVIAPLLCLSGYLLIVIGILRRS